MLSLSLIGLPLEPLAISGANMALMEVLFLRHAKHKPELRGAHRAHMSAVGIGGALFILEEVFPETPYIHAAWHCMAALGIHCANQMLL